MNSRFAKPPLLEIVAELRWGMQQANSFAGQVFGMPVVPHVQAMHEDTFNAFTHAIGNVGFHNAERLIPQGFPWMPQQPVLRYRYSGQDDPTRPLDRHTLFQLGPGIFTANAIPPYTSWDDFSPLVRTGVEALIVSHASQAEAFALTLRYIDAFTPEFTDGASLHRFMNDVLGIHIELPSVLNGSAEAEIPMMHIIKDLGFGQMTLQFAQGNVRGQEALLLDMAVTFNSNVGVNAQEVMERFSQARSEIHKVFVGLTEKIHDRMSPIGE